MPQTRATDLFVSNEPAIEVDEVTSRILKERMKSAKKRFVPAQEVRKRVELWLSKSSITKKR